MAGWEKDIVVKINETSREQRRWIKKNDSLQLNTKFENNEIKHFRNVKLQIYK